MGDLTLNFDSSEFACPCCNESRMHMGFMNRLQDLREAWGKPFKPVPGGGYRCKNYSKSSLSTHMEGRAIDPNIPRQDYHAFIRLAFLKGFTGIGIKQKNGSFQLHIDDATNIPGRPRPWVWTY